MKNATKVAAAVTVLLVAAAISTLGFFFYRDNFATHYPVKVISQQLWRAGEVPYWNFFDGGGQPLAGNPNTLSFYPDNVLYLFLPSHVAFNLHFLIHLALGWLAMRALTRSNAAAWVYALSGVAISATAFYNMVTAVALIPFALLAAERRSAARLGLAFGLLALAGEPVTMIGAAIAVAIVFAAPLTRPSATLSRRERDINPSPSGRRWREAPDEGRRMPLPSLLAAVAISIVIALPQLLAYSEIAKEVERAHGYSARTVLNASLPPLRLLEIVIGPLIPRDPRAPFLFLSLFIGIIAIPALFRRSRYTVIALTMLFFALGRYNPLVAWIVEALPSIRIVRFPEKFALPMTVAIVVLATPLLTKRVWRWVTLGPLAVVALFTIPLDWFEPYQLPRTASQRISIEPFAANGLSLRNEYRMRAARREPLFGATSGLRYAVDRSPDGMFSLMTRIATERYTSTRNERWLRIGGINGLPRAFIVPRTIAVRSVPEAVNAIESPSFDERTTAVAPMNFTSPTDARVTSFIERPQALEIGVTSSQPALLFVNETYFRAWDAGPLRTLPLDLDRLGVIVPAGETHVTLRFGRHRTAIAIAWLFSTLLVTAALFELLYRGSREIQRSGDDDAPAPAV
ncbi:MAG: hypothetical protein JWO97_2478 [Acidobacteria bacterium]|nr:hypothetical protein [Acidobacteriota bacterium]